VPRVATTIYAMLVMYFKHFSTQRRQQWMQHEAICNSEFFRASDWNCFCV
jgi:hypothetical protein